MSERLRWIDLAGAVNVRDLGGLATKGGGTTRFGQVLRSDNLQELTEADVEHLVGTIGVREVVDLRTEAEVRLAGPGPLTRFAGVSFHHVSLFAESGEGRERSVNVEKVLPWRTRREGQRPVRDATDHYLNYLADRPDSVVAAIRLLARGRGATVVNCAAGKDRTGVVCALALDAAGVVREEIVADYALTGERAEAILRRLRNSDIYAADVESRTVSSIVAHPIFMEKLLAIIDEQYGGARALLDGHGWTEADQAALSRRLIG
ncbi:MAG TPA: tyrosine-protein phosphatase [Nonomuraea sp.]|nr:tyrosine-protein phosphatase [Nonomuraea sp.]